MKCRFCKRDGLPDDAVWCCWCGERVKKERKAEIKIPEPRLLRSGRWTITLRKEGISFTRDTAEECRAEARAIRLGIIEMAKHPDRITLGKLLEEYISSKDNVLSPSTIAGYDKILQLRFKSYINTPVADIPWQRMINAEPGSPKTIKNAWGLVAAALRAHSIPVPDITLPQVVRAERPFLAPSEIPAFISALDGHPLAIPALLALHSLRASEIAALTWEDIDLENNFIHVRGAVVLDKDGNIVRKRTNKNASSHRNVPIFIPKLKELLAEHKGDRPCMYKYTSLSNGLYNFCQRNGLPRMSLHCLRHSFASLAYSRGLSELAAMRIGGWSDYGTMRKIYTHLADEDLLKSTTALEEFFTVE